MNTIFRSGISGAGGTALMTVVMLTDTGTNFVKAEMPPKRVSDDFERAIGLREHLPKPVFEVSWLMMHFGYGTQGGAGYAVLEKILGRHNPLVIGSLYGTALYLFGYALWLPIFNLYPSPVQCSKRRNVMTWVEHLVYGSTVAMAYQQLRQSA